MSCHGLWNFCVAFQTRRIYKHSPTPSTYRRHFSETVPSRWLRVQHRDRRHHDVTTFSGVEHRLVLLWAALHPDVLPQVCNILASDVFCVYHGPTGSVFIFANCCYWLEGTVLFRCGLQKRNITNPFTKNSNFGKINMLPVWRGL